MSGEMRRERCFNTAAIGDNIIELELCALDAARAFFGGKTWVEISKSYTVRLAETNPCSATAKDAMRAGKIYYSPSINVYEMVPNE
jgi:hypothetical protein